MNQKLLDRLSILIPVLLALVVTVGWLMLTQVFPGTRGSYHVKLIAPQASQTTKATSVTVAGLPVGRVNSAKLQGNSVVFDVVLKKDHAPLPRDTRFAVRLRTLVGENYIELYPGKSKSMLPDNSVLGQTHNKEYVEADQILSTLRGKTRTRARQTLQSLGAGLDGREQQLNSTLENASGLVDEASPLAKVLHRDRRQVARLVDDLGTVTRAVGERGEAIRSVSRDSRATFQAIGDRDLAVRDFMTELPPTIRQVRSTTGTIRTVNRQATPVLYNLATALREAKPAVKSLRPAAAEGRDVVSELSRAAPPLQGTLRQLRALSPSTVKAAPQLRKVFCQVNPAAKYLKPYATDISTFINNLGSVTNYYDANGHAARIYFTGGPNSIAAFDKQSAGAVDLLTRTGFLGRQTGFGYNAYMKPGHNNDLTTGKGVSGPTQVKEQYPHVKAEC